LKAAFKKAERGLAVIRRESVAPSEEETGDDNGLTMAQLEVESRAGETRLIVRLPVPHMERTESAEAIVATHASIAGLTVQLKATA
jgi:hypothetical protein